MPNTYDKTKNFWRYFWVRIKRMSFMTKLTILSLQLQICWLSATNLRKQKGEPPMKSWFVFDVKLTESGIIFLCNYLILSCVVASVFMFRIMEKLNCELRWLHALELCRSWNHYSSRQNQLNTRVALLIINFEKLRRRIQISWIYLWR